jgi:hypothetical protein
LHGHYIFPASAFLVQCVGIFVSLLKMMRQLSTKLLTFYAVGCTV